jgi:hypothetical protein
MRVRIFDTLLDVPDDPPQVELAGEVMAHDHYGRVLIVFDDMAQPCWLPTEYVLYELEPLPVPHTIWVQRPDGKMIETDPAEYGRGIITIPDWLAAHRSRLTAAALRDGRDQSAYDEAQKRAARRDQEHREARARLAAKKKQTAVPGQGDLF